jgi:hypothetical protein
LAAVVTERWTAVSTVIATYRVEGVTADDARANLGVLLRGKAINLEQCEIMVADVQPDKAGVWDLEVSIPVGTKSLRIAK